MMIKPIDQGTALRSSLCYDARALLAGQTTVQIVLDDQTYTLRITKANKLILTK